MGHSNSQDENSTTVTCSSLKNNYLNSKSWEQKDSGQNHYKKEEEFKLMSHQESNFQKPMRLGNIYQVSYFEEK